ncbi:hypothetical protein Taro_046586 [Colocasia esculenta]|uniref:Uncharacterized protein n=1 Tax=Colocasia esculenta TaxID=4460 RepID=A0A843X7I1_COLES|nr:hypothetical protein [Colocasia esculenta]
MAGVLPGTGQPVLFLTASLFAAPEPPREDRRGTVVRPDYGGYCCVLRVLPHSDETWRFGPRSRIRCGVSPYLRSQPCGGHDVQRQGARRVEEMGVVVVVPVASSGSPSQCETSQRRQGARRAEETGR